MNYTEEVNDLIARLKSSESYSNKLYNQLMESKLITSTLSSKLAEQEEEIERLTGRVKYLEDWLETEFCFSCDEDEHVIENDPENSTI